MVPRREKELRKNLASKEKHFTRGVVGLQIAIREIDDVTVLDLRGRSTIDDGSSELLGRQLRKLTANGVRKLLLNLVT